MKYTEVTITLSKLEPYRDLLIYSLGDEGPYDSFENTNQGLKAYVPTADYDEAFLEQALDDGKPREVLGEVIFAAEVCERAV